MAYKKIMQTHLQWDFVFIRLNIKYLRGSSSVYLKLYEHKLLIIPSQILYIKKLIIV